MDKRGKRIVYLSNCLINQNLRFPGIAVESGALNELLNPLLKNGIGIEPLPCLERLGWGGVRRQTFYKYLPIISENIDSIKYSMIKLFLKIWLRKYKKLCKKEIKKAVHQMQDYYDSGYSILGVIMTNDSPTCGFTKTIKLREIISKPKELKSYLKLIENPTLDKMRELIPNLCENGSGFFTTELINQLKKRKIDVQVTGFDIWDDLTKETERIIGELSLIS